MIDIAQVSKRSGVAASTLRFYEDKGLIASIGRHGLRRVFDHRVLDQLSLIALGRVAGFSLDEIATVFAPDGGAQIDRAMLGTKADQIDETVKRLQAMSDSLRHAAVCPAPSHMQCPSFRKLLQAAAKGELTAQELMPQRRKKG